MLNKIKELANQYGLLYGITSKDRYEEFEPINERYSYADAIICFAMPIKRGQKIMASYAMEKDYHIVLKEILEKISGHLGLEKYDIAVDNSPISDKICAYTAGLGFRGKHSIIITSKGSYVMLGEIITDVLLKPSEIKHNDCGSCAICSSACPVDAIGDVYNRCIAGLLQRKVEIEFDIAEKIETIYGCDICQDVCPFNKKIELYHSNTYENIDIFDIMKCNKKEFQKYKEYAFYWLGHNVMKRNIIIYAKNKNINIDHLLEYVNSKEAYMLKAIEYYWR